MVRGKGECQRRPAMILARGKWYNTQTKQINILTYVGSVGWQYSIISPIDFGFIFFQGKLPLRPTESTMSLCQAFQDCCFPFWSTPNHILICFSLLRLENDSMNAVLTIPCFVNDGKVTIESRKRNKFAEIFGLPLWPISSSVQMRAKYFTVDAAEKRPFNENWNVKHFA